jgi:hypothetical protein
MQSLISRRPIAVLVLAGAGLLPLYAAAPTPIALTGYNYDIVTDANEATRFAQPNDIGTAAWFESGAVDDGGVQHLDGLPQAGFTSAFTNTVTGGQTAFGLAPFNGNNALLLRNNGVNTGTMQMAEQASYESLAILASGYNASSTDLGSVVLNFADGSHSGAISYNAFDWGFGATNVALGGKGRNSDVGGDGRAFNYNRPVPFATYETDLDLVALGFADKPIQSLTFTGGTVSDQPGVPGHGPSTSIFAVSGSGGRTSSVPEPGSLAMLLTGLPAACLLGRRRRHPRAERRTSGTC